MLVEINQENFRLSQCEQVIEKGLKSFVEMGSALKEIRESRLYKDTHDTFENYCDERWQMSRIHAFRLIQSNDVIENLLPIGNILPNSESQVRPLAKLDPSHQQEVWQKVVEKYGDHITAKNIEIEVLSFMSENPSSLVTEKQENGSIEYRIVTYLNPLYKKKFDDIVDNSCGDTAAAIARKYLKEGIDKNEVKRLSVSY